MSWQYKTCEECGVDTALLLNSQDQKICRACFRGIEGRRPRFEEIAWYGCGSVMAETWVN